MKKGKKQKPLTPEQKEEVWEKINDCDCDDKRDREPQEVIKEDYKGDEDAYLRAMAKFHAISFD